METDTGDAADVVDGGLEGRLVADRFRVVEVVSRGASTVIANALDTTSNQPVTIKVVRPELAESDEFRRAFRRHAEIATALSHPNIATVIAWGDVDLGDVASVYWVVEYLSGGSLRDLFDRGRLLEPSQALLVGLEACRALDVAHQRGIAHTELTPAKMVFGEDRRLRIVDFGFARLLGSAAWADPATVPTHVARYASPEQALGLEVGVKTDVYALALALIEAVTGAVPFAADSTVATLAARIGKLMPVSADLGSLAAVLERAGRPEADDRSTAAEFGKGLVRSASKLPRPEPIPIVAGGLFSTAELRRPTDPTGGRARPATPPDGAEPVPEADVVDTGGAPIAVAAAGVAATGLAAAAGLDDPAAEGDVSASDGSDAAIPDPIVDGSGPAVAESEPAATPAPAAPEEPDVPVADAPMADAPMADAPMADASMADAPMADASAEGEAATSGIEPATSTSETPDGDEVAAPANEPTTEAPPEPAAAPPDHVGGSDALIVLTDVADPPTGAVEVGTGQPAAPAPSASEPAIAATNTAEPTVQMPVAPLDSPAVYDDERRRPPFGKIIVLTLVVLTGLAALTYAGWFLLRTKSFEVPALAGVNQDVALNEIAGNGWMVTIDRERNDAEPTIDNVIRTVPGPGVKLDEGAEILIVVSDGPELRTLPEVAGEPLADVETQLRELRLNPVVDARVFSETVPAESVVVWRVQGDDAAAAGSQVLPETTILLTVSDGPEPRAVPALAGLLVDQATTEVESLQLVIARGDDVFSDAVPVGVVVSQDPPSGTRLPRGDTVTIQVSKGPDVVPVPDLNGLSYADAEALLSETGFTIGNLLGTTEGTFVSMTIEGESVEVGQLFRRGTAVDLIFL